MSAVSVEVEGDTWEWHSAVVFPGFWSFLDATAGCYCRLLLQAATAGCCCKPACSTLSWAAAPLVHQCCTSGIERGGILLHCTHIQNGGKLKYSIFPYSIFEIFSSLQ